MPLDMSKEAEQLIYSDYWNDHLVEIEDKGDLRSLYFGDRSLQSRMSLSNPQALILSYTCHMTLPLLINPSPRNILIVGIGAGSFIRFFHHHYPDCHIDAVDYAPQLIETAKNYFQLPDNKNISLYCADGQGFLQDNITRKYDLILIDAFDDQGMAPTVYSEPFFRLCTDALGPNGLISANLWSDDKARLREIKTILADYFTSCLYLPVPNRGNIVAVAMPFTTPWPRICLKKKDVAALSKQYAINFRQLIDGARRNNMSFTERLATWRR
jgi:spermidine synthase